MVTEYDYVEVAVSGPNANSTTSPNKSLPKGKWITSVAVTQVAGTAAPRGRYYVEVFLTNASSSSSAAPTVLRRWWAGYGTGGFTAAGVDSLPNAFLTGTWYLMVNVTGGTNGSSSDRFRVTFGYSDTSEGASFLFYEAPGSGRGEMIVAAPADPGAGAQYPTNTVPNNVRQRINSLKVSLVSSATVINRRVEVYQQTAGGKNYHEAFSGGAQPASDTVRYSFGFTGGYSDTSDFALATTDFSNAPLPDVIMLPGHVWALNVINFQTGAPVDTLSAQAYELEEWAVPVP